MRSGRFRGAHQDSNSSIFSHGARRERARERAMSQMFQYKDKDGQATQGPTTVIGFFEEDAEGNRTPIAQPGMEYEIGGRIYKTDNNGHVKVVNTQWLRDRQIESNDERDRIFALMEIVMDIEDDDALRQLLGNATFEEIASHQALPSEISLLPLDSKEFAYRQSRLKKVLKDANIATDQLIMPGQNNIHRSRTKGGNVPDGMEEMLGIQKMKPAVAAGEEDAEEY